ncbi:MAG: oxidoreductase [Sulfurimonas sp. RIFOXYD12_FULL_33_39]|uniref:Gfo/Idh/MocA family protein n=1 Tax=unclassified Sulfurimonas TaxID=2623549 RepID=UPI0008C02EE9|nr:MULTISPECIES: Gfo/Idh/MocA family oxidoreductase [unclassified Sulfurimonas]OHE10288.1 MAG: oxidoreductase [Sulfurimonas sp. RIFOXYD12_FULL_33_39]OHE13135.1 MAG: oxidoreductase [Sulfurimonas sp. RIFOXYD2_FULL_34_21]DAB27735.1 MAG TPA: oxidoreductase [Sulfurimonas sp. UBA10385]
MKVLIIGYGSIGKRHCEVLSGFKEIESIDIVTKQNLNERKTFSSLQEVHEIDSYDYIIISSQTNKHYEQLSYLEQHVKDKIILCEKPLFETDKELHVKNNIVYVGYVLRFHPLLQRLKELLKDETVLSANAVCGQYLPAWRPNTDYTKCYSAKKEQGGGVLLDLSHEIDYVEWLCGNMIDVKSYQKKISDLEIDSDDFTTLIGVTDRDVIVNITVDYISKITHRTLHVNTLENSYTLDFINATLIQSDKNSLKQTYGFSNLKKNYFFENMHKSVLKKEPVCCDYEQAKKVMQTIKKVQEQR